MGRWQGVDAFVDRIDRYQSSAPGTKVMPASVLVARFSPLLGEYREAIPWLIVGIAAFWVLMAVLGNTVTPYLRRDTAEREINKLRRQVNTDLRKLERRGVTARNRLERQVKRTRTQLERQLRQRRNRVNRLVKRNGRTAQRDLQRNADKLGDAVREVQSQVTSLV